LVRGNPEGVRIFLTDSFLVFLLLGFVLVSGLLKGGSNTEQGETRQNEHDVCRTDPRYDTTSAEDVEDYLDFGAVLLKDTVKSFQVHWGYFLGYG
jgi:hypothetical protein